MSSDLKRQHVISLLFLAAMMFWIGIASAVYGVIGWSALAPPPIAPRLSESAADANLDDHHEDRYLDWGASMRKPRPLHLSVRPRLGPVLYEGEARMVAETSADPRPLAHAVCHL